MNEVTQGLLLEAVDGTGPWSAISIRATMRPTGPAGTKVAPPSYPTSPTRDTPYLVDTRWLDGESREVVHLDSPQSQANRCEEALLAAHDDKRVSLPLFELAMEVETEAGPRDVRLTSLDFPHRYADAYLRDAELDGTAFDRSEVGKRLRRAEPSDATVLFEREPYSLVYGAWDSHRSGRQARFPRIYDSTIIGLDPEIGLRQGGRLDPLNLTGGQQGTEDGWDYVAAGEKKKGSRLSEIGHGNAMDAGLAHGHASITEARRLATIHLGALRGIRFGREVGAEATAAGRAALVALALLGDRLAFGTPSVFLRSGCDLATVDERLALENPRGEDLEFELDTAQALDLFAASVEAAGDLGLSMGDDTIAVTPKSGLADAIAFSYTKADSEDA